jgi:hypothetical protein
MIYLTTLFSFEYPKKNWYVYCFVISFKTAISVGFVKEGDTWVVATDEETAQLVINILGKIPPWLSFHIIPKPANIHEGIMLRYLWRPASFGETVMYMDVDIIALRPMPTVVIDDTLLVNIEGHPDDSNYCGDKPLKLAVGLTAGIFAYNYGPNVRDMFDGIIADMRKDGPGKYYTIDQPYFNHAIAAFPRPLCIPIPPIVCFNKQSYKDSAIFVNFCGDCGSGFNHFEKMFTFYVANSTLNKETIANFLQ